MASSSDAIDLFSPAMIVVYGPFPSDSIQAESWTPPPKAGGFKSRYLWTDAFGVVNFITLLRESQDEIYLILAKRLVQTIHDIQGRTRNGKFRLPGATEGNPLGGGLRIDKDEETGLMAMANTTII